MEQHEDAYPAGQPTPWLHKQQGKGKLMAWLFTFRKAGGLQILRCQGIAVAYYGVTLDG